MIPHIQVAALTRHFPPATQALAGIDLEIQRGERVAIMGQSGSGKSTLLAILGLLDSPTAGTYLLDGADVTSMSGQGRARLRRDHIGFVFQAFHLVQNLTAAENVQLSLEIKGVRPTQAAERARAALEEVDVWHRADALPSTMSGGEQQRVAIARALAPRPDLLLCDEPTGNLDSRNSQRVMDLLMNVVSGATLVLVTHAPDVAAACDRRFIVTDGRVVA